MKPDPSTVTVTLAGGKTLSFETGKIAKQAHGSTVVRFADNVVLATAVANAEPREGVDFFPLTVDYREYTYAGGRFPGGFIKREGRMSEKEVLTSRQIDRPIRPMFAEGFKNETQVIALVLSADSENDPDVCGINAASAALHLSDIPFLGPVGAVRVGLINGQFKVNPTYSEMRESLLNIMVVGTSEGIVMIESGAKEVKEETVVDAIEFGHNEIKKICAAINELRDKAGKPKRQVTTIKSRRKSAPNSPMPSTRRSIPSWKATDWSTPSGRNSRLRFRKRMKKPSASSATTTRPCASGSSASK